MIHPPSALTAHARRREAVAVVTSLVLHGAVALALMIDGAKIRAPAEEPVMTVDIVPPPAPKAEPPAAANRPSESRPIPQLGPGELATQSSPDGGTAEPSPAAEAAPGPARPAGKATPTRSKRDLVLSQVLANWRPPPEMSVFPEASVSVDVTVLADGTLAPPFSRSEPWNPAAAIDGYDRLPPRHPGRRAVESFYRAIRVAQPLTLPAALKAKAPFKVRLDFRLRDVRR